MNARSFQARVFLTGLVVLMLAAACSPSPTPPLTAALPSPFLPTADSSPTVSLPIPNVIVQASPTSQPSATAALATATLTPTSVTPTVTTAPIQVQANGPYAVINVAKESVLVVHEAPSKDSARVIALKYNDTGLMRTGRSEQQGETLWWELAMPEGKTGWVNSSFLTEAVPLGTFCADGRIQSLLASLKKAYNESDGTLYSSLISPRHGLSLTYLHTGRTANYNPEEAKFVFASSYVVNWGMHPASGMDILGTFHETVLPYLTEVLNTPYTMTCNAPGPGATNYTMVWPESYENIRYMALYKAGTPGIEMDWRVWLIGFEYIDSKPYLFSMIHFFWEP